MHYNSISMLISCLSFLIPQHYIGGGFVPLKDAFFPKVKANQSCLSLTICMHLIYQSVTLLMNLGFYLFSFLVWKVFFLGGWGVLFLLVCYCCCCFLQSINDILKHRKKNPKHRHLGITSLPRLFKQQQWSLSYRQAQSLQKKTLIICCTT